VNVAALLACASAVLLLIAGCGDTDDGSTQQAGSTTEGTTKDVRVAFFHYGPGNTYAQAALDGGKHAAEKAGAELTEFGSSFDAQTQRRQIQDAIASGQYDAFVIQPANGAAIVDVVEQAVAKGIKVASASEPMGPDRTTNEPQVEGVVVSAQEPIPEIGKSIGRLIVGACEGVDPCEVAYLLGLASFPSDPPTLDAVKETIASHSNIELVATAEGEYLRDPAYQATQDILQAHPDLDVIATVGDQMTLGAEQAVVAAGREGKVKLIGNAASEPGVAAVREGRWYGDTVILPFDEGRVATEGAIAAAKGEDYPYSGGVSPVEEFSPIGPLVLKKNAGKFKAQWRG
jgi:ribose transport system substrate-binding protein